MRINPCPFCGNTEHSILNKYVEETCEGCLDGERNYFVLCRACGGRGSEASTPEKAIKYWNGLYTERQASKNFIEICPTRFKIKPNVENSGCVGWCFGRVFINNNLWVVILFDEEEEPVTYEAKDILLEQQQWVSLVNESEIK